MRNKTALAIALRKVGSVQFGTSAAIILLLILTADALARLSWRVFGPPIDYALGVSSVSIEGATVAPRHFDIEQIRNAQLFGSGGKVLAVSSQHVNAPATKLDLVLRGIMFAENPADSRAILSTSKGPHRAYGLDAQVPGGPTLEAMYADRVLLRRAGALETLFLTERRSSLQTGTAPRGAPRFSVDNRNNLAIQRALTQLRREALLDPAGLQRKLRIQPVGTGADFKGFRVLPGPAGATLLNQLGLQAGDTITRVNDLFLDQPLDGMKAMQDVVDASEVTISVLRRGNLVSIGYRFND